MLVTCLSFKIAIAIHAISELTNSEMVDCEYERPWRARDGSKLRPERAGPNESAQVSRKGRNALHFNQPARRLNHRPVGVKVARYRIERALIIIVIVNCRFLLRVRPAPVQCKAKHIVILFQWAINWGPMIFERCSSRARFHCCTLSERSNKNLSPSFSFDGSHVTPLRQPRDYFTLNLTS